MKRGNALCISTKYQHSDTVSHKIIRTDVTILFSVSMEETWIKNYKIITFTISAYTAVNSTTRHVKNKRCDHICVTVIYSFSATRNQDNKYKYTYYYI